MDPPVTGSDAATARACRSPQPHSLAEIVQQRLRLFEIRRVETLGEPAVDRGEKVARFGGAILLAAEPSEAHRGPQLPELGLLLLSNAQSFAIELLSSLGIPLPQQQLAFVPIQLRCEPAFGRG